MTTIISSEVVLAGRGLSIGYGRRVLFRDLAFEVGRGEILGIVGPNGSGKTTLLRTILGLLPPLDGHVERQPNLNISYVPQRDRIDVTIPVTVLEVVLMGRAARAGAFERLHDRDRQAAHRALGLLNIDALAGTLFRNISTGQQQRVLLARALATDPDVLVLDEPTVGMDIASEAGILEFLEDLHRRRRVTILIVTHLLPIVLNLATSIMLMGTRAILHGSVDDVMREDRLSQLYGVPVHLGSVVGRRTLVVGQGGLQDV